MQGLVTIALVAILVVVPGLAQRKLVCYYSSWAVYRPGNGRFDVEDIDPFLCTHAIYAFIGLDEQGGVFSLDPWQDIELGGFARFTSLRNINPALKTMVAIGGWNANSSIFSDVAGDAGKRQVFITNLYNFVRQFGFDGLDVDWEYPAQRGGRPEDKGNFIALIRELRALFAPEGLLLTAAVHAAREAVDISYDVPVLSETLDLINLMTYDFHGPWDNFTGINAPLYPAFNDPDQTLNVDAAVQLWLSRGAAADKLMLGIPMYGHTFTLENDQLHGLFEPTSGPGEAGEFTRDAGFLSFNEICVLLQQGGWAEEWDPEQQSPYMYRGNQWVGFDNINSVRLKAQYGVQRGLGGSMVWAIDSDDFRSSCGMGPYPLANAVKQA